MHQRRRGCIGLLASQPMFPCFPPPSVRPHAVILQKHIRGRPHINVRAWLLLFRYDHSHTTQRSPRPQGYKVRQEYLQRMAFLSDKEAIALKIQVRLHDRQRLPSPARCISCSYFSRVRPNGGWWWRAASFFSGRSSSMQQSMLLTDTGFSEGRVRILPHVPSPLPPVKADSSFPSQCGRPQAIVLQKHYRGQQSLLL